MAEDRVRAGTVGDTGGSAVEIIAEVANAHQGQSALAIRIAESALGAGADAVKFQIYSADELLIRRHPRYEHFRKQSFDAATWDKILSHFVGRGIRVYADLFGLDAFQIAAKAGIYGFKIHSSDLANRPLLEAVAGAKRRVLLSVGGSTVREIDYALRALAGLPAKPVLLHGFQAYPTAVQDSSLLRLEWLKDTFGSRADWGYQDHIDGSDAFAVTLPAMAIALGARVIEKHVTLDRAAKGVDYYSSLDVPHQFGDFAREMRRAQSALGANSASFSEPEGHYRRTVKKHWVAARDLPSGHRLSPQDLVMKRVSDTSIEPVEIEKLIGRPLVRSVAEEEICTRDLLSNSVWALVVARMASRRMPGKALADVGGMPALAHLFARLRQAKSVERIVFCTTEENDDDPLVALAQQSGVPVHRGPVMDVLGRMLGAIDGKPVDIVLRVTGDDILVDPDYVDRAVAHHCSTHAEYTDLKALPPGTEVEVFDAELLRAIWKASVDRGGTEYLTTYVTANRDQFRTTSAPVDADHAHDWRLTLDTIEDYEVVTALLAEMRRIGKGIDYRLDDIVRYFRAHPEILDRNATVRQRSTPPNVGVTLDWRRLSA